MRHTMEKNSSDPGLEPSSTEKAGETAIPAYVCVCRQSIRAPPHICKQTFIV